MKHLIATSIFCTSVLLTACGGGQSSNSTTMATNNKVYMPYASSGERENLWETDGTVGGTTQVHDFLSEFPVPSYDKTKLYGFVTHQDNVYFNVSTRQSGGGFFPTEATHLYSTETLSGSYVTQAETTVKYGLFSALSHGFTKWQNTVNNDLYITGDDPTQTNSINGAITKIDSQGMATDISAFIPGGISIFSTSDSVKIGDDLYYYGKDVTNYYLVKLDTINQVFTTSSIGSVSPIKLFVIGSKIFIHGKDQSTPSQGAQLYGFNTTSMSLSAPINGFNSSLESIEEEGVVVGNKLYFITTTIGQTNSSTLYVYDDANGSTTLLISLDYATGFIEYNDIILFVEGLYPGSPLWKTDGTANGTVRVNDSNGNLVFSEDNFTVANGNLYFSGTINTQQRNRELWSYDFITGVASQVLDINAGNNSSSPSHITELNGGIVFQAATQGAGSQKKLVGLLGGILTTLN